MNSTYEVGQVWEYKTREGEENSRMTVVALTEHQHFGLIINISLDNLKIRSSHSEDGFINGLSHSPCSQESINNSVISLVGKVEQLPDFQEGYDEWKTAFDEGKAGVFGGSIQEIISTLEEAIQQ